MSSGNLDATNTFMKLAEAAVNNRDFELAKAYTDAAAVAVQAHLADKVNKVAEKIDRLASVVNAGKSWR